MTKESSFCIELVGKRIELLKEWLPQIRRVAILARPQHPGAHLEQQATETVLRKLGIDSSYLPYQSQSFLPARDLSELGTAFRAILQDRCDQFKDSQGAGSRNTTSTTYSGRRSDRAVTAPACSAKDRSWPLAGILITPADVFFKADTLLHAKMSAYDQSGHPWFS